MKMFFKSLITRGDDNEITATFGCEIRNAKPF